MKKAMFLAGLSLCFSACTVKVNSPGNTVPSPSASPTATSPGATSPTPSTSPDPSGSASPAPTPSASPPPEIPTAGLIEYLDFSAAPPTDESIARGVTQTTDRLGQENQAWHFDGSESFLRVNRDLNAEVLPQVTLSAWVRSTNANPEETGHIISHDNANTSRILALYVENNTPLGFAAAAGPTVDITRLAPVQLNTWQFLTASYDPAAGVVNFYMNGQLVESNTQLASRGGYEYFYVGASPFAGRYFEGDIDEVRVYNRVLSEAEVQDLYAASLNG